MKPMSSPSNARGRAGFSGANSWPLRVLFFCALLAQWHLCAAAAAQEAHKKEPLKRDDWAAAHYQVFAIKGPRLGPVEVRELLLELREAYRGHGDESTRGRKSRVEQLLAVSEIGAASCSRGRFEALDSLLDYYDLYTHNLIPFLEHHAGLHLDHCVRHASEILAQNVAKEVPDRADHQLVEELTSAIVGNQFRSKKSWPGELGLRHALQQERDTLKSVLHYLGQRAEELRRQQEALEERTSELKRRRSRRQNPLGCFAGPKQHERARKLATSLQGELVSRPCAKWLRALAPTVALLSRGAQLMLNESEQVWMEHFLVCSKMESLQKEIGDKLVARLLKQHSVRSSKHYRKLKEWLDVGERLQERRMRQLDEYHRKKAAKEAAAAAAAAKERQEEEEQRGAQTAAEGPQEEQQNGDGKRKRACKMLARLRKL